MCVTVHVCGFEPVNCVLGAGFSFVFFVVVVVFRGWGVEEGREWGHLFMQAKGNHHQGQSCPLCLL